MDQDAQQVGIFHRLWTRAPRTLKVPQTEAMRSPQQLPTPLRRRAFTRGQLPAWGIHPDRVKRRDVVGLGAGTFALRTLIAEADEALIQRLRALALAREFPQGWLSHGTAAQLLDRCAVPAACQDGLVHVSIPAGRPEIAREGVRCHRVQAGAGEVFNLPGIAGIRISAPGRLWREASALCSVEELVALGDSLVRKPYPWVERRTQAYTSIAELSASVERAGRFRGKGTAIQALPLLRVGADSAMETAFRLALLRAGLPEPELQIPLDPTDPRTRRGDMGYRRWKLVIQYDGGSHYTAQRHRTDQRRDNDWVADGWLPLRINVVDNRDGFVTAVGQVDAALRSRGFPDL